MRRGMTQTTAVRARGAATAGVVAVAVALAGGCTPGAAEPEPTPTVSAEPVETPSATPTPTPTVPPETVKPEVPAAMSEPGTEGAAAAAQYFLSLYPYVYATGDLAEWQAMSHPECVFCASVVTNVQAQVAAGQHSEGGMLTMSLVNSAEVSPDLVSVVIEVAEAPSTVVDADGSIARQAEGGTYLMTFVVLPGARWTVREVEFRDIGADAP